MLKKKNIGRALTFGSLALLVGVAAFLWMRRQPANQSAISAAEPTRVIDHVQEIPEPLAALQDQYEHGMVLHGGIDGIVLIVADDKRGWLMEPWSVQLIPKLPSTCQIIRVLNLRNMSPKMAGMLRQSIKIKSHDDTPIYLDWTGAVADKYSLPIDLPNIVCLGPENQVLKTFNAEMTPDFISEICAFYN